MNIDDLRTQNGRDAVQMHSDSIVNINLKKSMDPKNREELMKKRMENAPEGFDQEEASKLQGRDLGNGVHEFVPASLGIHDAPKEEEKDDITKALEIFDKEVLPAKIREVQEFNAAIDMAGEISEEEVRQMQGKDYITKVMEEPRRLGALKTYDMTDEEVKEKEKQEREYWEKRDRERQESQDQYAKEMGLDLDNLDLPYDKSEEVPYDMSQVESVPNPTMDDDLYTEKEDEENIVMEQQNDVVEKEVNVSKDTNNTDDIIKSEVNNNSDVDNGNHSHDDIHMIKEQPKVDTITPSEDNKVTKMEEDENDEDFVLPESQIVETTEDTFDEFEENEKEESEDSDNEDEENEEIMERFKKSVREKIKPVTKAFDISTYSVSKKTVPFSNAVQAQTNHFRSVKWALMSTGRPITMRSFKSTELDAMNAGSRTDSRYMNVKKQYQMIYNHIMDPKPKTVEEWAKVNSFLDLEHIWFSVYRACFEGSNYIPRDCVDTRECKEVFLSEDIPIMDMVKFKDKDAKKRFFNILNKEPDETSTMYVSEIVPVSDDYAFALREPSIYNIVFETALLEEDFLESHQDLVSVLAYVDSVYKMDHVNKVLVPIQSPYFQNNVTKTYKTRIKTFSKVLDTLTSDQYRYLLTLIDEVNKRGDDVKYIYPEMNCPKCGKTIPESDQTAQNMVFLRHQLVALAI